MSVSVAGREAAAVRRGTRSRPRFGQGTAAWFVAVCVVSILLCLPFLRTVLGEEDGIWLNAATRLRHGHAMYRDFFQFLPPLSFLLTRGWLDLWGESAAAARVLAILAIAGSAGFAFLACRRATGHAAASAALVLAWVVESQGVWTQLNHHWFTLFFSAAASWAALSAVPGMPGLWRPLLAGLAGGAAGMVTPTRGALVVLACAAVFLPPRRTWPQALAFLAGVAVVPLCLLVQAASQGALADAFNDVILFTAQQYSSIQHMPYGHGVDVQTFPCVLVYPACAVALAALAIRDGRALLRDTLLLPCAAFGLAGLVGSYPRADTAHLNFALPLALPLAGRCAVLLAAGWPAWRQRAAWMGAACLMLPSLLYFVLLGVGTCYMPAVETPAGPVRFVGWGGRPEVIARLTALPQADKVFFYPYDPMLPFLSGRGQVSKYDLFLPSYTTAAQYRDACASVMQDADWVLLDHRAMSAEFLRRDYPSMPDSDPLERQRFERALAEGFATVSQDASYELRRRTPAAQPGSCEGGWP